MWKHHLLLKRIAFRRLKKLKSNRRLNTTSFCPLCYNDIVFLWEFYVSHYSNWLSGVHFANTLRTHSKAHHNTKACRTSSRVSITTLSVIVSRNAPLKLLIIENHHLSKMEFRTFRSLSIELSTEINSKSSRYDNRITRPSRASPKHYRMVHQHVHSEFNVHSTNLKTKIFWRIENLTTFVRWMWFIEIYDITVQPACVVRTDCSILLLNMLRKKNSNYIS